MLVRVTSCGWYGRACCSLLDIFAQPRMLPVQCDGVTLTHEFLYKRLGQNVVQSSGILAALSQTQLAQRW